MGKREKLKFLRGYCGGQKLELLYWALSPIYQQEYVRGGVNVWKGPIGGDHAGKCSKALVQKGYPPRT